MFNINHEEKELPSINMSMKLQGYLLGYEVLQGGVIVQSHRYAKPVKNLVVNKGKDFLLKTGGNNMFGYNSTSNSGVLGYCGRGSSSTPATATDTDLVAQIGTHTSTILPGDPNTGTRFDKENGKVVMRVTHDHEVESSDRNINELGWFGELSDVKHMFSRVVLPSTITVLTGQSLRTIYQLELSITPIVSTPCIPSISGWTTDGDYRWECAFPATSTVFSTPTTTDFCLVGTIATTGVSVSADGASYTEAAALSGGISTFTGTQGMVTMYGSSKVFNTFGARAALESASATVYNAFTYGYESSGTKTCTAQTYTDGTFYRDRVMVFEPNWTGYSSISIYAMRLFGLMYIFDTPQTKTNTQRLTLNYRISVS